MKKIIVLASLVVLSSAILAGCSLSRKPGQSSLLMQNQEETMQEGKKSEIETVSVSPEEAAAIQEKPLEEKVPAVTQKTPDDDLLAAMAALDAELGAAAPNSSDLTDL